MEIEYKVAKLDAKGNAIEGEWLNQTYRKTVYDSSIISDAEIMKCAREALESASVEIINGEIYVKGVASNDLWFEGWISSETGEIISYYPIIP
ncbi:CdiA family toxin C-terminal domain-containing protein [Ruminococcus sp.]|uniref:CdiA family toxin C-terminal domain-containing protein n=1 Tax=Ruminococcus sp. TaxID=41978 RepID=UPI0025E41289|nr:CdiA family toxin C-terminal domain-containing protein [Ruminococcus sp.]